MFGQRAGSASHEVGVGNVKMKTTSARTRVLAFIRNLNRQHKQRSCLLNLPVAPQDLTRLDEKWSIKGGYTGLDRAFGVNWNERDD